MIAHRQACGAVWKDSLHDEAIEIGAERRAAIPREGRADPAGSRLVQGAVEIARPARGRRQPVAGRGRRGVFRDLRRHPRCDAPIELAAVRGDACLRLAIERGGPPVERALVRKGSEHERRIQHGVEQRRRGPEPIFEIQPFRQPDRQLDPLARVERTGIHRAQRGDRVGEIVRGCRAAIALELDAPEHDPCAFRGRREADRLAGGAFRGVVLTEVVEPPRL